MTYTLAILTTTTGKSLRIGIIHSGPTTSWAPGCSKPPRR